VETTARIAHGESAALASEAARALAAFDQRKSPRTRRDVDDLPKGCEHDSSHLVPVTIRSEGAARRDAANKRSTGENDNVILPLPRSRSKDSMRASKRQGAARVRPPADLTSSSTRPAFALLSAGIVRSRQLVFDSICREVPRQRRKKNVKGNEVAAALRSPATSNTSALT